jgi:lysophospholipase L1-like esterase
MSRSRQLGVNLLIALFCTTVFFVVAELVLRARWEPKSRTLAPLVMTRTTTAEYNVVIETNRQGFRDTNPHLGLFPKVAVIGDSFVFGSGAASEDLLASRLRPHIEAWNFGVPGTGPFNALHLWRSHVKTIQPAVLMVALYAGNDASDALRETREARPRLVTVVRAKMLGYRMRAWWQNRKHASLDNPQAQLARRATGWNAFGLDNPATMDALLDAARKRGVPEDSVRARLAFIPDSLVDDARNFRSNPFNLAEAVLDPDGLRHNLLLDTPEMSEGWAALETALRELKREVETTDTKLAVVCIPAAVQVDSTYWWLKNLGVRLDNRVLQQTEFQNRLAVFCAREQIPLIDLLPAMRSHPDRRLYYEQDGHWNAAGHDVAARAISEKIKVWLPVIEGLPEREDSVSGGLRF